MFNLCEYQTSGKFIGLVGLGYWGRNVFRNLVNLLHTCCDIDTEVLSPYKKKYPAIDFTDSFEDLLRNPEIKAVAIATPANTHYKLVKSFLIEGKDVFVEKPLSLTSKEGEELVELAEKNKRILMVGHILHYHPAIIKLKELLSTGVLGKIQYIYSNRLNIGKLRTEENILWSFAPHDISVILMLLDKEPINISAFGGDYLNTNIYDTTLTMLEFQNEIKSHIFVSWLHPYKEQKLVVVGSKAMAVFDDMTEEKLFLFPHKIEWKNGKIPIAQKADYQVIPVEKKEPLKEELNHFIECVVQRKRPITDGREGLKVLRVLERAEISLNNIKKIDNGRSALDTKIDFLRSTYVHESAYVDANVKLGNDVKIWHFSHVLSGTEIGNKCIIGQNVMIGPDVKIGNGCKIQNNVSIYKGVTLEDEVFCGPSCVFTNVYNPRAFIERKHQFRNTLVKKGATIGANSTIICGVTIGKYSIIGAGAVVKSDVPDYAIAAGVPAKKIGWACKCGRTLKFEGSYAVCDECSNEYKIENDNLLIIRES